MVARGKVEDLNKRLKKIESMANNFAHTFEEEIEATRGHSVKQMQNMVSNIERDRKNLEEFDKLTDERRKKLIKDIETRDDAIVSIIEDTLGKELKAIAEEAESL